MSSPGSVPSARRWPADALLRARDERLEALKAVVGKLAHDFNNFLAPQYGYLTMLKDEASAGSTIEMYLSAMGAAAQKAEAYISAILLGMRPNRQFAPRDFLLNQLVEEVLDQWIAETPGGKEVRVQRRIAPAPVCADDKQWRALIEALLSNARFALAMGGELEVMLDRQQISGDELQRLGLSTDSVYCLRVRDSGFGMAPDVAARVFEPFFTTRTQVKAAGLGLTIAHGITQLHGGQIELASTEDLGTTVTVWLPVQPVRPSYSMRSHGSGEGSPCKVLLIEDDPLIKEVLRAWIVRHNIEVESAATETEARRSLERAGADCVLVLCETDLQAGRGEDFYARLAPLNGHPAWAFLAGKRLPELPPSNGANQPLIIKKPISHFAFSQLIRGYTQRR